jgi:asparagine synthase (glutamine-hydrolysing)
VCGIAGAHTPGIVVDAAIITDMVRAMAHRGPDGEGHWVDGDVGLGMRRLAIVDVEGGEQPIVNESGTVHAVFNGEIYNHAELRHWLEQRGHRMRSRMDGEVIPHLWEELGERFPERLDGIFAIALWDARQRALILARDHLGVKPLYMYGSGESLWFASELKALLRNRGVPRRLDYRSLDEYLTFRFTPSPHTLLDGVEKLEPASCLLIRDGVQRRFRYWDPAPVERHDLSLGEAAAEYRELLGAAVRRQMMSDRPIGAMLSGGIDSGAVVAMMAEAGGQVKTFTVGFEGSGDADETGLARETARLFGTDHHDAILLPGDFREELSSVVEMLEEPVAHSSAIGFREVSRLAHPHVPVLLSGQGADELLGGYWRYVGERIASRTLAAVERFRLRRPLAAAGARVRSARLERGLRALRFPDTLERFMQIYAVFDPPGKAALYSDELRGLLARDGQRPSQAVERYRERAMARDSLAQMMFVDTRLWLPDDLLLVGDKMSMAQSVEMRVPFLDRQLVEFVESLPTEFKLRRGRRKLVHKQAMSALLPRAIVHRRERGFINPVNRWLRGPELHGFAAAALLDPGAVCGSLFSRPVLESLLQRHRAGTTDHTRQLFCLLSLELWGRRFLRPQASDSAIGAGRSAST